jgi:hypothetical protein
VRLHGRLPSHGGRNGGLNAKPNKPQFVLLEGRRKEESVLRNKNGTAFPENGPVWFCFSFLARSQLRRITAYARSPGKL